MALLVDGVTKFDKAFYGEAAEVETIRKMIVAAGKDVRVLIIKLADRLHNMRTLDARSLASRARIARATQDVLVPLCDRLGIQALKRELEDSVLLRLEPDGVRADRRATSRDRPEWTAYLDDVIGAGREPRCGRSKIGAAVVARPRHLYSIWKDTVAGGHDRAVRPAPHRDRRRRPGDRLLRRARRGAQHVAAGARPVQGLHRLAEEQPLPVAAHHGARPGRPPVEVLIRTEAMHRDAEYGIAADFRFPQAAARPAPPARAEQLDWLRRVLDWETDGRSTPAQFLESLRCDLADGQIHVFAEAGGRCCCRPDATPVDLAYALSPTSATAASPRTVNGRLAPAVLAAGRRRRGGDHHRTDGDRVRLRRRPGPGPPEWLNFVKYAARAAADQPLVRRRHASRHHDRRTRCASAGPTIGLALRQHDRGLASDAAAACASPPSSAIPDLETLLVAVADHVRPPATVVAHGSSRWSTSRSTHDR